MEKAPIAGDTIPSAESKVISVQSTPGDQPLPPLPADNKDTQISAHGTFNSTPVTTGVDELVEAPKAPNAPAAEESASKAEMTINDRTPQQALGDIEMPDAPPVAPVLEQPAAKQEPLLQTPPLSNLPPPPPLISNRPLSTDQQASNGAITTEHPKWLLPPMADRFRGKKCLVLDLDETLVHSSFKVGDRKWPWTLRLTRLDPAPSRLHYTR